MYDGYKIVANALRGLDRPVAVMGALASRFEYRANDLFDGTLSGLWNFARDPILDAWDRGDYPAASEVRKSGLVKLHEYVADMGRLHIRYKTATWIAGFIPSPFMRAPMPKSSRKEAETLHMLMPAAGIPTIERDALALVP